MKPLLPLDDAVARLVDAGAAQRIADVETVDTFDALGRVLAADVASAVDVPPADNSAMDGYALRAGDAPAPGSVLPVAQRVAAGQVGAPLAPGTAARIFTGAPLPSGADTVAMQEDCVALPGTGDSCDLGTVRIDTPPTAGRNVRRRGEDVRRGSTVLVAGTRLTPQALGLAASVGAAVLQVRRRPRVALLSTGDELVRPGQPLPPGAIYNSNRYLLHGLVQAAGCEAVDLGSVPDRLDATRAALRDAAARCDVVVSSGGVSVGEEDHLRPAVQAEGSLELWQVAIKPGKPLAFGRVGGALFVGLPGNPVAVFVTFVVAVAPMLCAMQGAASAAPQSFDLRAEFNWPRPDRRREFLRARPTAGGGVEIFPNQGSGVLTSTVWADGLVDVAAGQAVARGDTVRYLPLAALLGR